MVEREKTQLQPDVDIGTDHLQGVQGELELVESPFPGKTSIAVLNVLPRIVPDTEDADGDLIKPEICEKCSRPKVLCTRFNPDGFVFCSGQVGDQHDGRQILIEIQKAENIEDVGLQLWAGALILADYLLFNSNVVANKRIVELGAGVGFVSIITAFLNPVSVICTDAVQSIVSLSQRNAERNLNQEQVKLFRSQILDWSDIPHGLEICTNADVVLIADCLYDETATRSLAKFLHTWFSKTCTSKSTNATKSDHKRAFISLEKRYYFSPWTGQLEVHDVPLFFELLQEYNIRSEQIDLSTVPIRFKYGRIAQHELWTLTKI